MLVLAICTSATVPALSERSESKGPAAAVQTPTASTAYLCPMHPDVVARVPGKCPRCGMTLAHADPYDAREFLVDVVSTPIGARRSAAGARAAEGATATLLNVRLRLTVREPATRAVVRDFVEVHEKRYHLFVVSHDLEHYDHLHPEQRPDGSFMVDVTMPQAGIYTLVSDFLPLGGMPQVIPASIATRGYSGTLVAQRARLVPDATLTKTVGGMRITLALPPDGLVAGRDESLRYHIADASTGAPVTDIQPYLAAFGHTLVVSEDTLHYVHAHPADLPTGDAAAARGGPDLTFKALLPKAGKYRVWTQIRRRDVLSTVSFTVAAASPSDR